MTATGDAPTGDAPTLADDLRARGARIETRAAAGGHELTAADAVEAADWLGQIHSGP